MAKGEGMVLVHGNGPQVGMILLRIEATKDQIPPETLDIMVAETQGSIGLPSLPITQKRDPGERGGGVADPGPCRSG